MLSTIIIAFAVGYSLYAWRHGELFSSVISWLQDHCLTGKLQAIVVALRMTPRDSEDLAKSRVFRIVTRVGEKLTYLALCPLCLSFWLSLIFSVATGKFSLGFFGLLIDTLASAAGGYWAYQLLYAGGKPSRN